MFRFIHNIWFKRFEIVLCCIALVTVSILCVLEAPIWMKIIGVIGIAFFGIGGVVVFYKSLTGKHGVSVDDNGIYVNGDFVKWVNVTEIEKVCILHEEEMLVVRTNDFEQRLAQAPNMFVRWTLKSNYIRYGGILIDNWSVDGTLDAFRELCLEYKKRSGTHIKY